MTALVEPPSASTVAIALLNEASRKISRGLRFSQTISTMRRPDRLAILGWLASTAGMLLAPAKERPRTSATLVIVEAVPIVIHVPAEPARPSSICIQAG